MSIGGKLFGFNPFPCNNGMSECQQCWQKSAKVVVHAIETLSLSDQRGKKTAYVARGSLIQIVVKEPTAAIEVRKQRRMWFLAKIVREVLYFNTLLDMMCQIYPNVVVWGIIAAMMSFLKRCSSKVGWMKVLNKMLLNLNWYCRSVLKKEY